MAMMVFVIAKNLKLYLDINKSVMLALVHDIVESITGDIDAIKVAKGIVTAEEKEKNELLAIEFLRKTLPTEIGNGISELWHEFNDEKTVEARFVVAMDKIETLTQLAEAGHKCYDVPEFIANYADQSVKQFPALIPVLKKVKQLLKQEFIKGNIPWYDQYDNIF